MKFVLITHADLDGVACAILVQEYCKEKGHDLEIYKAHYSDVNRIFNEVYDKRSLVMLTDISLEAEPSWIAEANNVLLIDHHITVKSKIKNQYVKFDRAGCNLVYDYYTEKGFVYKPEFKTLMTLANDYDLFSDKYKMSNMLNYLFFLYKFEGFLNRFKDGYDTMTQEEVFYLKQKQKQIKNVLTNMEFSAINEHVAFVTTQDFLNEISRELYTNRGFIYVFIYNPIMKSLSLRAKNDAVIHCGEFLQIYGGGGHRCAGGITIGDDLKKIDEILKGFGVISMNIIQYST